MFDRVGCPRRAIILYEGRSKCLGPACRSCVLRISSGGVNMSHDRDFAAGWLDSSVNEFLNDFPSAYGRLKYSLITSIDSNTNPASLIDISPELAPLLAEVRPLGQGLLVLTKRLLDQNRGKQIFFGFDEIWFSPRRFDRAETDVGLDRRP